jgi:hypothetical protein
VVAVPGVVALSGVVAVSGVVALSGVVAVSEVVAVSGVRWPIQRISVQSRVESSLMVSMPYCSVGLPVVSTEMR